MSEIGLIIFHPKKKEKNAVLWGGRGRGGKGGDEGANVNVNVDVLTAAGWR